MEIKLINWLKKNSLTIYSFNIKDALEKFDQTQYLLPHKYFVAIMLGNNES